MTNRLLASIRHIVQQELLAKRGPTLAVVTGVFPHEADDDENNYEASVHLKHEDLELRRVPVSVDQMGVAAPLKVGNLVLVQFVDGNLNQPLITDRFYHADERPPLHKADETLFEQRLPDGTLNHLRFTDDGSIYLQRKVTKPEDNSEALTSIRIDGESGDLEIKSGDTLLLRLSNDGNKITVTCDQMTINGPLEVDGDLQVTGNTNVDGDLVVGTGPSTTISGNSIQGGA